ncbi:peptidylprolyl isomerase [Uliginosibacterium sp. H3]|uniref:peptidylprolyl isomerase n=1 Tax=Uliginosibacterium silvisoli TaxID=3114758 RepID=A0ABU6K7N7_9RHOO|nr:peptidylprolyl isomerase [Uliginosibacterium sp. H3]
MKSRLTSYVRGTLWAVIASSALAVHAAPEALATVNGKAISSVILDVLVADQGMQGKPQEAEFRNYAKGQLIQREVMAQQAQALKLDKAPAYQAQLREMQLGVQKQFEKAPKEQLDARIAFNTQGLLAQAFVDNFEKKNVPTDAAMRAAYKRITQGKGGTEYKVRHIQLDSEAEAKAVIGKLVAGARFDSLVGESKDLGSKGEGGDLGWVKVSAKGDEKGEAFPAAFSDAVRKLAAGGFTREPVKTDAGYHVILVEAVRELPVGSYESYQAEISDRMKQEALSKEIQSLMQKARIS